MRYFCWIGKTEKLKISRVGLSHVAIHKGRVQLKQEAFQSLHEQRFRGQDGWSGEEPRPHIEEALDAEVESRLELDDPWASVDPNQA